MGTCWDPMGKGFTPHVSLLVETFRSMMGAQVTIPCTVDCWDPPQEDVSHQKDSGAHAKVISYLDEVATCQPSQRAWDKLVWPPASTKPAAPPQLEVFGYIQGLAADLGPTVSPAHFHVTDSEGAFICSVRGLVLEGSVLAYNPSSNEAEWIPVRGTSSDLSQAEERSACVLANLFPHAIGEEEQLKFGRCREIEGSPMDTSMDNVHEEESCNMMHPPCRSLLPSTVLGALALVNIVHIHTSGCVQVSQ